MSKSQSFPLETVCKKKIKRLFFKIIPNKPMRSLLVFKNRGKLIVGKPGQKFG